MKRLFLAVFSLSAAATTTACDGCNKSGTTNAAQDAAAADAGPTAPLLKLDVSDPSPHAWNVSTERFPAVSEDGASVALLVQKEDGTRGYSNAAVEIRRVADDTPTASISILEADAIVAAEDAPDAFHTTLPSYKTVAQSKADDAVALLARTKWVFWNDKVSSPPRGDAGAPPVLDGGFTLALKTGDKPTLLMARATDKDMATPVLTQDASAFLIATRKTPTPQKGNPSCAFTPYIAETSVDGLHHVVIVRIAQAVRDNVWGCFEPSQWHVYRFAP